MVIFADRLNEKGSHETLREILSVCVFFSCLIWILWRAHEFLLHNYLSLIVYIISMLVDEKILMRIIF